MPVEQGCVTFKAAATATAASAAFPPFFSIEIPAFAANGWVQATQPCLKSTGEWPNMAHDRRSCGDLRMRITTQGVHVSTRTRTQLK